MVLWLMEGDIGTVPRRWTQTYGQCRHHHQAREGQPALKHWFLYPIRNKFPGLVIKTDQLIPAVNIILDDKRWKQSIYHLPNTTNNNRSKPSQNCGQKHQRKMTVLSQSDQHTRTRHTDAQSVPASPVNIQYTHSGKWIKKQNEYCTLFYCLLYRWLDYKF